MAKLSAYLSLDTSKFASGITSAKGAVGGLSNAMRKESSSMAKGFAAIASVGKTAMAGIAAATAAFAGAAAAMKTAIGEGGTLADLMARTGAAGQGLVILQQAFKNAGVEASKVPTAINRLQKALSGVNEDGEETANAFGKLGLSAAELTRMDAVEAFRSVGREIAAIESPAGRAAAALEIFGKSGGELLAVMTDDAAWEQASSQIGAYADELTENAARFDQIGDSVANYEVALKRLGVAAATIAAPALEWLAETLQMVNEKQGGKALAAPEGLSIGADGGAVFENPEENKRQIRLRAIDAEAAAKKAAEEKKATEAAKKKAAAESEAAEEKSKEQEKTRAAALEEYKLEARILLARISGNEKALEAAEREKKIREQMEKLESAGFTSEEARRGASLMVDKTAEAEAAEKARKSRTASASSLGGFAQSMNVIMGRSANDGMLEESKRQTKLLEAIKSGLAKGGKDVNINVKPVFST